MAFRSFRGLAIAVTLLGTTLAGPGAAQTGPDMELANEFLTLELAGWRLPDPMEECLTSLRLRRLEPMAFGSEDLVDQPELVDPPGPHYRVLRIEPDGTNRRRRNVQFEWLLAGSGGPRTVRDSFAFTIGGDPAVGGGRAMMQREPDRMVIRRECFGG
jgi:hypothetical protein